MLEVVSQNTQWFSVWVNKICDEIKVQQNSNNLTRAQPDGCQIIEYSVLRDSTYTDQSSYR
jgi:hypothetical protein